MKTLKLERTHNKYFPKRCSCGRTLKCIDHDIRFKGRTEELGGIDWFDCISCKTTFAQIENKYKEKK